MEGERDRVAEGWLVPPIFCVASHNVTFSFLLRWTGDFRLCSVKSEVSSDMPGPSACVLCGKLHTYWNKHTSWIGERVRVGRQKQRTLPVLDLFVLARGRWRRRFHPRVQIMCCGDTNIEMWTLMP